MEKMCRIPALVLHETAIALVGAGRTTLFWHGNRYAGLRPKTCAVARIRRVFGPRLTQSGQIHPCIHQLTPRRCRFSSLRPRADRPDHPPEFPPSMPVFGFSRAGKPERPPHLGIRRRRRVLTQGQDQDYGDFWPNLRGTYTGATTIRPTE